MSFSISCALQNFGFPRGLAPRFQRGPFALQSRHWHHYVQPTRTMPSSSARYRPAPPSLGPTHSKRRHHHPHLCVLPFQRHQFHILLCPNCFTSYRLGSLYDTSLDSFGSRRRRSSPLPGTRYPETRRRRRGRRENFVSTQRRHQT